MRRHVFSSIAILVMVLLAFGSTNSNTSFSPSGDSAAPSPTSKSSETDHSNPSSPLSESSNAEVDRVYEERFSKYEQELAAWNAADDARKAAEIERADLQPKIDQLEKQKPITPEFEEREWVTIDGRYKTLAVLVDTDYIKIKLRKSDGKDVTVERDKLDAEGRIYIGKAFSKLQAFRRNMKDWEGKRQELTDNLASAEARIASAEKPKPEEPTRQSIADEIASREAKRREETPTSSLIGDDTGARVMMWQFIEDKLTSPGSAHFGWIKVIDHGNGRYSSSSHVDAQNAFGGVVRLKFDIEVRKIDADKWVLESLEWRE